MLFVPGPRADAGPPSPRVGGRRQEHQELVCEGAQDQGHLPHPEPVQSRRDAEVPHRRVLGASPGPGDHPTGAAQGNGTYIISNTVSRETLKGQSYLILC